MSRSSNGPEPRGLESLLDLAEPVADWSDADVAAMLRHQLAQPLEPGAATIGELLGQPDPSIESLQSVKRHAKVRRSQKEAGVPQELWRVIYFASIAAAIRSGHSISDLSPAEVVQGFNWTLARLWVDESIRGLVNTALRLIDR
jgi:hypothetical protein